MSGFDLTRSSTISGCELSKNAVADLTKDKKEKSKPYKFFKLIQQDFNENYISRTK